jgi:hypothetical protein
MDSTYDPFEDDSLVDVPDNSNPETTEDEPAESSDRRLMSGAPDVWSEPVEETKPNPEQDASGQEQDGQPEQPAEKVPPAPPVKTLKFKSGDTLLDVPEAAMVTVKVDGKSVEVPITELMTNYSGKTAWDKRFSELTNERRSFAAERHKFSTAQQRQQKLLEDFHKSVGTGDTFGAISTLVSVAGLEGKLDPRKYVAELRTAIHEQAARMAQLSPEERAQIEAREEYEYTKKQLDELRAARDREQSEYQAQVAFAQKLSQNKLQAEDLQRGYDYLLSNGNQHGIDANTLTPDQLLNYTLSVRKFETAIGALHDVSPEVAENRQFQDEAVKLLEAYPETTKEQLAEIFREAIGQKRSDAVSKKVSKSPVSTPALGAARAKQPPKTGTSEIQDLLKRVKHKGDVWDL